MEEQEINLMDYIKTILKRGKLIAAITVLTMGILFFYSFLSPRIYEVSTVIEIGINPRTNGPIETVAQVTNKIISESYGVKNLKAETPTGTNLVIVKKKTTDPQGTKTKLEELNNLILSEHQKIVDLQKSFIPEDIEQLNSKIKSLQKEMEARENKLRELEKIGVYQQSPTFILSYLDEKKDLEGKKTEIENLQSTIKNLERSLSFIYPTKIVKTPAIAIFSEPRIIFNIVIGLVLGLFLGIVISFSAEWWQKNKKAY